MAITQALPNSFKKQLLDGDQDFSSAGGDVFKLALYISTATLGASRLLSLFKDKPIKAKNKRNKKDFIYKSQSKLTN
jgi:hypothetical protein